MTKKQRIAKAKALWDDNLADWNSIQLAIFHLERVRREIGFQVSAAHTLYKKLGGK